LTSGNRKRLFAVVAAYLAFACGSFLLIAFGTLSPSAEIVVAVAVVVATGIASYVSARTYRR